MPGNDDHKRRILSALTAGELDRAMALLDQTDAAQARLGVEVLLPLARAMLAAGREIEALSILERASVSSAFGGDLEAIATEIGMPPGRLKRSHEPDTDQVQLPPAELLDTPVEPNRFPPEKPRFDTEEMPAFGLEGDGSDTDEVPLPPAGQDRPSEASDGDEEPAGRDILDDVTKPFDLGEITERARTFRQSSPVFDDDPSDLLAEDDADRDSWTKPIDLGRIEVAQRSILEAADEARDLRQSDVDATDLVTLPEHGQGPSSDTIEQAAAEARQIRAAKIDATNKLQLPDVEVVGFFQAGMGRSGVTGPPPGDGEGGTDEPAPSSPDAELDQPRTSRRRSVTTSRVDLGEAPKPRTSPSRRRQGLLVAALVLLLTTMVVAIYFVREAIAERRELEQIRAILASDTFEGHRTALSLLSELTKRRPSHDACAEYAVESALMWGRFGLEQEHRERGRKALASCRDDSEPSTLAQVLLELYGPDVTRAEHLARQGVDRHPGSARLRTALGQALKAQGEPEPALEALAAARTITPEYLPASLHLARLHRQADRRGEARVLLDQLLGRSPRHVEARVERLMLELDMVGSRPRPPVLENLLASSQELEATAQGQPPSISAAISLARGRIALLQGDIDRAGMLFSKARRLGLQTNEANVHISAGLRLSGDLDGAVEVSSADDRESLEMTFERIRVLLAVGRPAGALELLQHLPDIPPEREMSGVEGEVSQIARGQLAAQAQMQRRDFTAALEALERVSTEPPNSELQLAEAEVLLAAGRSRDAQRVLATVSARPWDVCAEAARLELRGEPRAALEALDRRSDQPRTPCALRLRSRLARILGDQITEISSRRSVLRVEPRPSDRIELVRSVWRERGVNAAVAELTPMLEAPPTGIAPLLMAAELLAPMGATEAMTHLITGAERAGARADATAAAQARFHRLLGQSEEALRLTGIDNPTRSQPLRLERAAALVALGRARQARGLLNDAEVLPCSTPWAEIQEVEASRRLQLAGFDTVSVYLGAAIRRCEARGATAIRQALALHRVELGLAAHASTAELEAALRAVPRWPPSARLATLTGRVAERRGQAEAAIEAYQRALTFDAAHLPALDRLIDLRDTARLRRQRTLLRIAPTQEGQR